MTESQLKLLSEAQTFVTNLFTSKVNKSIRFHNLEHTQAVVMAAEEMAQYYQLQDEDRTALGLAAWFHDSGFTSGDAEGHEERGVGYAIKFIEDHGGDQ